MARFGRALLLATGLALPAGLSAQNPPAAPVPVRGDTLPAASGGGHRDSAQVADSLSPDSFSAVLPPLGPPAGPMPRGSRVIFDRQALIMSGALTLGELLQRLPGTFLVRAGWYGLPEAVHYAGQGASSIEYYVDGYALDPMGEDSAGIDPSRIALGLFQRVEVEVLPTVLRVYLISDTQAVRRARTETSFGTGDASTNNYLIRYLNRWPGGLGVALGVNWFGSTGSAAIPVHSSDLTLWAKATWAPTTRAGLEWQYLRFSMDRDGLAGVVPGRRVWRSDAFFRAYASTGPDGMGFHVNALFGSSGAGDSSTTPAAYIAQGAAFAGYRGETWSAEGGVRVRDARVPLQAEVRVAATPLAFLTVEASAISRSVLGGRASREASFAMSARPLGPLVVHGAVRLRDGIAEPAVLTDSVVQRATDWSAGGGLATRRLDADVSVDHHGAWAAPVYGEFAQVVPFGTAVGLRTVTVSLAYRPTAYFTLAGWYRQPLASAIPDGQGTAAYEPPHHTRFAATFRSRFLPHFRRGALDVLLQVGVEAWGDGVMGTDSTGSTIRLDGHGTVDYLLEVRLLSAVLYWTIRNAQVERYQTIPGVLMTRASQRYGVRWEFSN